jgi:hypothetical protein
VAKLRQAEALVAQGKSVAEAVRTIGVTEPPYCRWWSEYGGLKQLTAENTRLWKAVADLALGKVTLEEAVSACF